jgi:hypothetical protein
MQLEGNKVNSLKQKNKHFMWEKFLSVLDVLLSQAIMREQPILLFLGATRDGSH